MTPSLSLCLIVKNEAAQLPRCLASVQGWVDEVVVVDTGSTDRTPEIAAASGARVYDFLWRDDFAAARNFGLDQARSDWLLVLDADEALESISAPRLRSGLHEAPAAAFEVWIRNLQPPDGIAYTEARSVRLFRNRPDFRFEHKIHEQLVYAIRRAGERIALSDLSIVHYGYLQPCVQGGDNRADRNLRLLEQAVSADPENGFLCAKLGLTYAAIGRPGPAAQYLRQALAQQVRHPGALNARTAAQARAALQPLAHGQAIQTLQDLLIAEDLPRELVRRRPELDEALLSLVQQDARAAQAAGEAELAEGLLTLAGHIAAALAIPAE